MISFPKGLELYNEVVQQILADSGFIPIKKKRNDKNKVNVKFCFLPRSLVGDILKNDTEFSNRYEALCSL